MRFLRSRLSLALAAASLATPGSLVWGADLLSIFREALANDAVYASAKYSLESGREALPQGFAGLLPTINATANTVRNDVDVSPRTPSAAFVPGSRVFNTNGYSITLTQPLFRWSNW